MADLLSLWKKVDFNNDNDNDNDNNHDLNDLLSICQKYLNDVRQSVNDAVLDVVDTSPPHLRVGISSGGK